MDMSGVASVVSNNFFGMYEFLILDKHVGNNRLSGRCIGLENTRFSRQLKANNGMIVELTKIARNNAFIPLVLRQKTELDFP
jgi:hypothetical protein